MIYEYNDERRAYLDARGQIILNACPGSGKTTTIAKKIINLEENKEIGRYSGVVCLSFTNSAKDEINEAYTGLSGRIIQFPNLVSTIDSFINKFITLPFYNILNRNFKRPKILDHTSILDDMWKVLYTDKKTGKLKKGLQYKINQFKAKNNRSIFHLYPPSQIRIEADNTFSIEGNQPARDKVDIEIFQEYCQYVKETQFEKGLISTNDSAFIALYILRKKPQIAKWLSRRFPSIIIDEAQDNSSIQHAIFEELIRSGLKNIELIGDPYQSLYEWRDADPSQFIEKYRNSNNWQSFDLTDNRRSPQTIVDIFSLLRNSEDPKINSKTSFTDIEPITIYKYSDDNILSILEHYEIHCAFKNYRKNNIVVRGNSLKDKLLGKEKEQRPWGSEFARSIIDAKNKFQGKDIRTAINEIRSISVKFIHKNAEYHELREIERALKEDHNFNSLMFEILSELPTFDLTIKDWTEKTEKFLTKKLDLDYSLNLKIRNRKSKYLEKLTLQEPVKKHFTKSYSERNIPITTIHKVKGKTLDSILVFFNDKKNVNNINFENIKNEDNCFPNESKRLIYVAFSRPKHLLSIALPNKISNKKIYEKFGDKVLIVPDDKLK